MHNLDPQRRDAMSSEINRNNLPPELSFKILLRFLRGEQLKKELQPLIQIIIQKTSDLKQKVREASMNICLYLSH